MDGDNGETSENGEEVNTNLAFFAGTFLVGFFSLWFLVFVFADFVEVGAEVFTGVFVLFVREVD